MAKKYTLDPDAVEDLRNIALYTETTWAPEQSSIYESKLVKGFRTIAEGSSVIVTFLFFFISVPYWYRK